MSQDTWNEDDSASGVAPDPAAPVEPGPGETEWEEEGDKAPRKKRGIPKWVWLGCGGGCLLAMIAAVIVIILSVQAWKRMNDPEYVWPQVEKILPFEERPAGYDPKGMGFFGTGTYFVEIAGSDCILMVQRHPTQEAFEQQFDSDSMANTGFMGLGKISNAELGTIEIQGREARCMRFHAYTGESDDERTGGASIRIDLTGNGSVLGAVQVMAPRSVEPITDAKVQDLLAPFDVWRDK